MKIMSHIRSATSMSCVEKITVVPLRFCSNTKSLRVSIFTGSSPLNGSSKINSRGSPITAAINCTFCDIPFDNVIDPLIGPGRQLQPRQPLVDRERDNSAAPFSCREKLQHVADLHLLVQSALLGQVSDPIIRRIAVIQPQHANRRPRPDKKSADIIRSVVVFPDPFGPMNP